MPSFDVDVSELLAFADDMQAAARDVVGKVRPAVSKGAVNVKNTMRDDMAASGHFGQVAAAISYDLSGNADSSEAQIGPTKAGAGPLANIAYFGGAYGGGGTVRDPLEAAEEERPGLEQALTAIVTDLL
jgi:hypothetical protein